MKESTEIKILKSENKSRNNEDPAKTSSTESLQLFDKLVQANKNIPSPIRSKLSS